MLLNSMTFFPIPSSPSVEWDTYRHAARSWSSNQCSSRRLLGIKWRLPDRNFIKVIWNRILETIVGPLLLRPSARSKTSNVFYLTSQCWHKIFPLSSAIPGCVSFSRPVINFMWKKNLCLYLSYVWDTERCYTILFYIILDSGKGSTYLSYLSETIYSTLSCGLDNSRRQIFPENCEYIEKAQKKINKSNMNYEKLYFGLKINLSPGENKNSLSRIYVFLRPQPRRRQKI